MTQFANMTSGHDESCGRPEAPSRLNDPGNAETVKPALAILLMLALVAPSFIMTAMSAVTPMIADYLGGGAHGQIIAQRAQALPFLGLGLGGIFAGAIIVRVGLQQSLILAALGYAAAGIAAGTATSASILLPACFLIGLSASLLNAGIATATGAIYSDRARARVLGFQIAFSDLAAISSSIVAGVAAQFYGWRVAFLLYPGFAIIILLLVFLSKLPKIQRDPSISNGLIAVIKTAGPVYVAAASVMFMMGGQAALVPFRLVEKGIENSGTRALILVAVPFFAMIASTTFGLVREKVGDRWLLLVSATVSAAGYVGLAFWQRGALLAGLCTTAIGIGIGFGFPMVIRAAFGRVAPQLHGYSMGVTTTASFLGAFGGPMVLGPLMRLIGGQATFLLCAAAWLVVGFAVFLAMSRKRALKL